MQRFHDVVEGAEEARPHYRVHVLHPVEQAGGVRYAGDEAVPHLGAAKAVGLRPRGPRHRALLKGVWWNLLEPDGVRDLET